jgi:hypothetical protein
MSAGEWAGWFLSWAEPLKSPWRLIRPQRSLPIKFVAIRGDYPFSSEAPAVADELQ